MKNHINEDLKLLNITKWIKVYNYHENTNSHPLYHAQKIVENIFGFKN